MNTFCKYKRGWELLNIHIWQTAIITVVAIFEPYVTSYIRGQYHTRTSCMMSTDSIYSSVCSGDEDIR